MTPCPNITPCDEDAAILSDINAESGDAGASVSCAVASAGDDDAAILSDLSAEHEDPEAATPCANFTLCDDTVLGNLTVESPDVPVEFVYDFTKPDPPLGPDAPSIPPVNPGGEPGTPTAGGGVIPPTPPPSHKYKSESVQWGITCPDGFDIIFSLVAGVITSSVSQADANTRALKIAEQYAEANELTWILPTFANVGTDITSNLTIINAIMPGQAVVWTHDDLPPGMNFAAIADRAAQLTGTPVSAGSFGWTIMAMDSNGNTITKAFSMGIEGISLTCDVSALYYPGVPASYTVVATGNLYPVTFTWNYSGTWLHLDAATGVMSGTPDPTNGGGPYVVTFSVLATDPTTGAVAVLPVTLRCYALPPFVFTTTALADYTPDTDYSTTIATTLGVGAVMFYADGLPDGLVLDWATGAISGTAPSGDASYSISLTVVELAGDQRTIHTTLNLLRVFEWTTTQEDLDDLPYSYGQDFSAQFETTIAGATFTYTDLPFWITGQTTAGLISGSVQDGGGNRVASNYVISVTASVPGRADLRQDFTLWELFEWVTPAGIADFGRGAGYFYQIETTISRSAVAFSVVSGSLPTGYSLTSQDWHVAPGYIPGVGGGNYVGKLAFTVPETPEANTYTFAVTATVDSRSITRTFTTIQALEFLTYNLGPRTGPTYGHVILMTGAQSALSYSLAPLSNPLPTGWSLGASNGLLAGPSNATSLEIFLTIRVSETGGPMRTTSHIVTIPALPMFGWVTSADGGLDRYTPGADYSFQVLAIPSGACVFSIITDPTGWLSISAGGVLSGTVPDDVADTITGLILRITDIYGRTADQTFSMTMADIADLVLTTTQAQIPKFTNGTPQTVTFTQTGAIGTPTWTVTSDTLGIAVGANPGEFIFTPDDALDDYTFHVELSDERGRTVNEDFHFWRELAWPTPPQTVTPYVKDVAYSFQIETTWSHTTPTFMILAGSLPAGLSMSSAGLVTGMPSGTASGSITVEADAGNQAITTTLDFTNLNFVFTTTDDSTPTGIPNFNPYDTAFPSTFRFATTIAYDPHSENNPRFSVAATTPMPKGLTLELGGTITGTAAMDSDVAYSVSVTATYSVGGVQYSITKTFTMRRAILFRTTQADFDGGLFYTPSTSYSTVLSSTLRVGSPVQVVFSSSDLPAWLSISSVGILSSGAGTAPAQSGSLPSSYTFHVTLTEQGGSGRTTTQAFTLYQNIQFLDAVTEAPITAAQMAAYLGDYSPGYPAGTGAWNRTMKVRGVASGHCYAVLSIPNGWLNGNTCNLTYAFASGITTITLAGTVNAACANHVALTWTVSDDRHVSYSAQYAGMNVLQKLEHGFENPPYTNPGESFDYELGWRGYQVGVTLSASARSGYYIPAWMNVVFTPGTDYFHVFGTRPNPDAGPTNWGFTGNAVETGAPFRSASQNYG